ncbi:unnamed protein product [Acanthoscelides obtectus]|uniref:Uncharacterized protein n=1 Tax=Acanthoscelides obtectus TaxID=200917 RepID=A0A9P0P056_ACAOB|nr:unnamed protein product [Acanthoscelides obtectus]CAK1646093.1 hypothetical protein AOBTE_LOCUS14452 [Acanthoscelides obtectus]
MCITCFKTVLTVVAFPYMPNVLQVDVSGEDMEVTDHNTDSISVAETPSSKKPWSCRRRPVIKKKKSMSSASSKFEELAMKKRKNCEPVVIQSSSTLAKSSM